METTLIRNDILIKRKFNSYLIPGVLMTVAMQLGNIVDSVLVSHLLDLDGLTAISLSMPVLILMQIIGFAFGVGSAAVISVMLGKREIETASGVFSVSLICVILLSLIFSAAAPFAAAPIAAALTPSPLLEVLLKPYLFIFMLFIPAINVCVFISNIMTVDNSPQLGAACFIISNVVNLVLDYIFLKFTDLGMSGAALSTIIGYATGLFVVILYIRSEKRMLSFKFITGLSVVDTVKQVIQAGASFASNFVMLLLQYFILNTVIQNTLGSDEFSIYAVCMNSVNIVRLCIEGVVGLIQTIAGVLYGEKDYYGIRALVKRTARTVIITALLLIVFFILFPKAILELFSFNKMDIYDTAILCVKIFSGSFVFFAANRLTQIYYQATLKTSLATLDTVLQGFVYLLPLAIILMQFFGIEGVCTAVILAELFAFVTVHIYRNIMQYCGKLPQKGFLMIPPIDRNVLFDASISSTEEAAVQLSQQLISCCKENNINDSKATAIGIAAEELAVNISRYGYKKNNPCSIDVCLSRTEDTLILRIRDDGIPFDPTEYKNEEKEIFIIGGIEIVRRIASKMEYSRVLNMNNTIIEIK